MFTLTNHGNTISGAGQFGAGGMEYDNKTGTIRSMGNNALVINLGQGNGVNEAGGFVAANGVGGMVFTSGYFTNNGVMTVNNGSTLTVYPIGRGQHQPRRGRSGRRSMASLRRRISAPRCC